VIAGGAKMFAASDTLEIGARNEAAVRAALAAARIPLVGEATGGDRGRTLRVRLDSDELAVTVKPAGGVEEALA
jgi:chemotaxis protein CheD